MLRGRPERAATKWIAPEENRKVYSPAVDGTDQQFRKTFTVGLQFVVVVIMVTVWILLCAILTAAGWILSAVHELNAIGYGVLTLLGMGIAVIWLAIRRPAAPVPLPARVHRWHSILRCRFGRPFPAAFLLLAFLAIVGGIIYPPGNLDALAYRIPRTLHWLAAGRWHWIHTSFTKLNTRACGFEWLSTPLILFLHTDRWLFGINAITYLLLPGLLFSVFRRLGVRPSVAWHWMWLLPSGYCFLLQAGGITNDVFAVVYALAAVDFALRARESNRVSDVWLSVLAAGLLAGSKASNLPLLLPWLIAVVPSARLLTRQRAMGCLVVSVSLLISFLPSAVLNYRYCGDWSGASAEDSSMTQLRPLTGIAGNTVALVVQNVVPTFYPITKWWDSFVTRCAPDLVSSPRWQNFEGNRLHITDLGELPLEDGAGLGFAISVMIVVSVVGAMILRWSRTESSRRPPPPPTRRWLQSGLRWSPYVALLAYMTKMGLATVARLIAPYYVLLVPALLMGSSHQWIVRALWWRWMAAGTFLLAVIVVVVAPTRPLWPARSTLSALRQRYPASAVLQRADLVYSVFGSRWDVLKPVRDLLPPGVHQIGYAVFGDPPEASLWRPFASRRVWHLLPSDPVSYLRERGIEYVVAGTDGNQTTMAGIRLDEWVPSWVKQVNGTVVGQVTLTIKARLGPTTWYVVRLPVEKTDRAAPAYESAGTLPLP